MEANLIKIGNSKGIIIPSKLLKLLGFKNKVHIAIEDRRIVITPAQEKPREGWAEMIKEEIQKEGQPERLIPDFFEDEQNNDWGW